MASEDAMDVESSSAPQQSPSHTSPFMDVDSRIPPVAPSAVDDSIVEARHVVASFLRARKADEIVPTNSRVVIVDHAVRLRHAFRALIENDVRAAPVIDPDTCEYITMLTAADAHNFLLDGGHSADGPGPSVAAWVAARPSGALPLRVAQAHASLLTACAALRDAGPARRCAIASGTTILSVLDHGRLARFAHTQLAGGSARRFLGLTVGQLGLGDNTPPILRRDNRVLDALRKLHDTQRRAAPVVDEHGRLIDVFAASDAVVVAGADWGPGILDGAVGDFLGRLRDSTFRVAICRRSDPLAEVFRRFDATRRHRLFVVDVDERVVGELALAELLHFFLEGF